MKLSRRGNRIDIYRNSMKEKYRNSGKRHSIVCLLFSQSTIQAGKVVLLATIHRATHISLLVLMILKHSVYAVEFPDVETCSIKHFQFLFSTDSEKNVCSLDVEKTSRLMLKQFHSVVKPATKFPEHETGGPIIIKEW